MYKSPLLQHTYIYITEHKYYCNMKVGIEGEVTVEVSRSRSELQTNFSCELYTAPCFQGDWDIHSR